MENNTSNPMSPTYIPEEYQVPYDIIEFPSQGILYPNKKNSVKVEYLTAMDESILTSPNIIANNKVVDVLLERKVKDLGFNPEELLEGDRMAILIFLRVTGFGEEYKQLIFNENNEKWEEGIINLSEIKIKKLEVKPDNDGLFDYVLPISKKKVKFRLLTAREDKEIDLFDEEQMKRNKTDISNKGLIVLERQIMDLDGEKDKVKISNIIKNLKIMDTRSLKKYISDIEPGLNLNTIARTQGGESAPTFLKFNRSFFWPEL